MLMETTFPTSDDTVNKAATAAHGAVDKVATAIDKPVSKVSSAIEHVAQGAHHAVDGAARAASAPAVFIDNARNKVRGNPLGAVAIALAAGFVIGRITR
jgi:ElaB/YqjD/DUF883 family membrane-anchored ribosome-binding protein